MHIPAHLLQECYAHGRRAYPEEGCGVLSGPADDAGTVTAFHPMENVINRLHATDPARFPRTGRDGYVFDPAEHMRLEKRLRAEGQEIRAIVHSHVDVGAYFSQEDITQAMWGDGPRYPGVVYLVCGIKADGPDGAIIATFNEQTGTFDETRIDPPAGG